jgi:hypothetical protein
VPVRRRVGAELHELRVAHLLYPTFDCLFVKAA